MPNRRSVLSLSERSFSVLVVAALALGFAALVGMGIAAALAVERVEDTTDWVNHTYEVERTLSRYAVLAERAEAARRGVMLTAGPTFVDVYQAAIAEIPQVLARLATLTRDNPGQAADVLLAQRLSTAHIARLDASIRKVRAGRRAEAIATFGADGSTRLIRRVRSVAQRMAVRENRLLAMRTAHVATALRNFYRIVAVTAVLLALVGIASVWVILRYTRDLGQSRNALRRLNENLEEVVDERTADLSRANAEIQRFAYIVSHDLRSPLVNVMGFTAELSAATGTIAALVDAAEREAPEIVTEEARLAAREDLPEAIGFIRSSTAKMDRLINAILKLSREGRRVIAPERLDLGAMVAGIRDSLAHRIGELEAIVDVAEPLPGLVSDRVAIEQVLSNLIENALKYTAAGRTPHIQVSGWREGPRVILEVADNGRGIDPRDHDRVFDLFRRSGPQDRPGEGIGLAHVRAVVYRLGGTIQCRSALGEGATFRVSLPAAIAGDQGAPS